MTVYFSTDTGRVRASNQDAAASGRFVGGCWGVVCDGMGGANGGDIASSRAVEIIGGMLSESLSADMDADRIETLVQTAVDNASADLFEMSQKDLSLRGMGTTVVCTVLIGDTAYFSHAGDSRAYLMGADGIKRITRDHSMVQELMDIGRLTEEQARNHPRRNVITRALGVSASVPVDHTQHDVAAGDIILLCSDGLYNCVEENDMYRMSRELPLEELCGAYIDAANDNGGHDNITALVISR